MNEKLKKFLDKNISEDNDTSKISVFAIPCGVGKSEYITYLLADALKNNYGLIVVTDMLDRLSQYANNQKNEQLTEYINRNISKITLLNSHNIAEQSTKIHLKPIILMTTQRYFGLTRSEIIELTTKQTYKRFKVVFDEKIYLLESRTLTVKNLNDIATALSEGLDNTVDESDKKYLIKEYEALNQELQKRLVENEQQNDDRQDYKRERWFDSEGLTITDKFVDLADKYRNQLRKYNPDTPKDLEAVKKLLFDGVITSQKIKTKKSGQEYKNYFTVVTNNADKLIDIGAKVFVLDGTADISPEYKLKCVNMVNCKQFSRDLSKLTINIVNVNTSKTKLEQNDEKTRKLIKKIIEYIQSEPITFDTVFTYQSIEKYFVNDFKNVNHFGNIKGRNDYRETRNICQVGLNRWSELIYKLYANEIGYYNDCYADYYNIDCFNDNKRWKDLIRRDYDLETISRIRCKLILADIEQNLFRGKIRNIGNSANCTYLLICSTYEKTDILGESQMLVDMIKKRYEKLGAGVNVIDTPTMFKLLKAEIRNTAKETSIQKFSKWLECQPKGREFKRTDAMREIGLTPSQFKVISRTGILNDLRIGKKYKIK